MNPLRQTTILDFIVDPNDKPYRIDKPIRLIELFGGIGCQAMALERLGANFEHYRLVEFDKYPVASYNAIHGTNFLPQDIRQVGGIDLEIVDADKYCYMMTYSFPCQDLSVAGKGAGMTKGSGTRSGLLWEVERILEECLVLSLKDDKYSMPDLLIMENVPQVHGTKNLEDWESWLKCLEGLGYRNFWKDLNSKNYGVAQNRNRCFMISIRTPNTYKFPEEIELKKVMKDYLEDEVDEKYYIKSERADQLIEKLVLDGKLDEGGQQAVELTMKCP